MPTDLIRPATSLGVAGFAIYIMWKMYQASAEERKRNDERMDAKDAVQRARLDVKDEEFRKLNDQVRTDIFGTARSKHLSPRQQRQNHGAINR